LTDLNTQRNNRIALASSQQQRASDPSKSVWVEASAGSGKTKVLSDRVLRLLLEGANPSHLLCLTYTKAAASEMNNRILEKLAQWAVINDNELIKELQKLPADTNLIAQARRLFALVLDTPDGIKIQTIHSFCQEILKRFPLEAKISPYFEVMDDRETQETLAQIKQDILTDIPANLVSSLNYLTANCSEYSFPKILSSITDNCNMLESYFSSFPDFNQAIKHISSVLHTPEDYTISSVLQQFWKDLPRDALQKLLKALEAGTQNSQKTSSQLFQAIVSQDFDTYCSIMLTKENAPQKNFLVKKSQEMFPEAIQIYHDECARLISCIQLLRCINLRDSTTAVLTLAREIIERYQQAKIFKSKMDYNDLISKTSQLLHSPQVADWVLYKLDGGIDHILIDEAQDTSPEQWSIIQALSQEFFSGSGSKSLSPTVFVVGDRKQSIYSFQGANVDEFEKMHDYFASSTPNFQTINMEVSFRSTAAVLDLVNTVFTTSSAVKGVVSSHQNINHIPSRIGECGHVELWELTYPQSNNTSDDIWLPPVERITAQSASSVLAQKIAELIRHKVNSRELKADGTPLRYSDFLILIQRRNSFAEEIVRACKNANVNITGIDKLKLNEQIVVMDLMSAARFVLLPDDDLNLCCLLKSPLFGLNDDDLFNLCYKRGDYSVWHQLQQNPAFVQTYQTLQELYNISNDIRPFEFFSYILNDLHGRRKFITRLNVECEDAIDEFINLTLSFEQDHIPTLQTFIEWMQSDDMEIKRSLEQNDLDAVRLMTVHGSKGLQSPVVILPDTVRFKNVKQEAGWLKDEHSLFYPLGKDYYDEKCVQMQTIQQNSVTEEYNRLLYVAMTRAGEQLYICGYTSKNSPNEKSWYEICKQSLSKISNTSSDHALVYHLESLNPPTKNEKTSTIKNHLTAPSWINTYPQEETPLSRPLTPSHLDDKKTPAISPLSSVDNSLLYIRGNLIHKLLQFLPDHPPADREKLIRTYITHQGSDFSPQEQEKIIHEVLNLISSPAFAHLFSSNSLQEVSVMGKVDNQIISGKIDRLVILPEEVIIIDYKTNRPAAQNLNEVPVNYIKQLQAYKKLISEIYPDKKITSCILWTNTAQIMQIP